MIFRNGFVHANYVVPLHVRNYAVPERKDALMTSMRTQKMLRSSKEVVLAAAGLTLATSTGPAAAYVSRNGKCESGEFCLYYYKRSTPSSVSDFGFDVSNYGDHQPSYYEFKRPGRGKGACVKNNAIGVWNRTGTEVAVYELRNYNDDGVVMVIRSGFSGDLIPTLQNNNASH